MQVRVFFLLLITWANRLMGHVGKYINGLFSQLAYLILSMEHIATTYLSFTISACKHIWTNWTLFKDRYNISLFRVWVRHACRVGTCKAWKTSDS